MQHQLGQSKAQKTYWTISVPAGGKRAPDAYHENGTQFPRSCHFYDRASENYDQVSTSINFRQASFDQRGAYNPIPDPNWVRGRQLGQSFS